MKIQGKTFLIPGGASGLGATTVRMIVGNGGRLVLADINAQLVPSIIGNPMLNGEVIRLDGAFQMTAK